jgi:hypothetical protein
VWAPNGSMTSDDWRRKPSSLPNVLARISDIKRQSREVCHEIIISFRFFFSFSNSFSTCIRRKKLVQLMKMVSADFAAI